MRELVTEYTVHDVIKNTQIFNNLNGHKCVNVNHSKHLAISVK